MYKMYKLEDAECIRYIDLLARLRYPGIRGNLAKGARTRVLQDIIRAQAQREPAEQLLKEEYERSLQRIDEEMAREIEELKQKREERIKDYQTAIEELMIEENPRVEETESTKTQKEQKTKKVKQK